jgi:hypothetical protein
MGPSMIARPGSVNLRTESPNILGACEVALLGPSWAFCTVLLLILTRSYASRPSSVDRCANCFALCPSSKIGFTGAHAKITRLLNPSRYLTCFRILLAIACPNFLPGVQSVIKTVQMLANTWIVWPCACGDSAPANTASTTIPSPILPCNQATTNSMVDLMVEVIAHQATNSYMIVDQATIAK